jgi:hypothetical protein
MLNDRDITEGSPSPDNDGARSTTVVRRKTHTRSQLIQEIANRAASLAFMLHLTPTMVTPCDIFRDIDMCDKKNKLRLRDLLYADEANFVHDVFGIRAELNRKTGELEHCFSPRYSA